MTRLTGWLLSLAMLVLVSAPVACAADPFQAEILKVLGVLKLKDFKTAASEVESAVKEVQVTKSLSQSQVEAFETVGYTLYKANQLPQCEGTFKIGLELAKRFPPKANVEVHRLHTGLAICYISEKRFEDANTQLTLAFSLLKNRPSQDVRGRVGVMSLPINSIYVNFGYDPRLEKLLTEAIATYDRLSMQDDIIAGSSNTYLGEVYRVQNKPEAAEKRLQQAIRIWKLAKHNQLVLATQQKLISLYIGEARFADAENLLQEAKSVAEGTIGTENEFYGRLLLQQGQLYQEQGKPAEATASLKQALAIAEKASNVREQANAWGFLSMIYNEQNKLPEGEHAAKQALANIAKLDQFFPDDMIEARNVLSEIYMKQDRYAEAEKQLQAAIELIKKYVPHSAMMAKEVYALALLNHRQGKYQLAEQYNLQALELHKKSFGEIHPSVGTDTANLGMIYADQRQYAKAEKFFAQSLAIFEKAVKPDDPRLAYNMSMYAEMMSTQHKFDAAEKLYARALAIYEKVYGAESVDVAETLVVMGQNNYDAGHYQESATRLKRALSIDEKLAGNNSAKVARDLDLLNKIYKKLGINDQARSIERRMDQIKSALPGAPPAALANNPIISIGSSSTVQPKSGTAVKNKWALVIGVSNFRDASINLRYAAKDAKDFAHFLIADGHFDPTHVKLLVDGDATRQNIIEALGDGFLASKAKPGDVVIIYVSSHGGADKNQASGLNFLVPYDATPKNLLANGIPMEWFSQIIKDQIDCDRVVVFLDVCHSGAAVNNRTTQMKTTTQAKEGSTDPGGKGLNRNFDVTGIAPGAGQIIVCSSLSNQLSWESKKYENSVFTRRLIDGLRSKGNQTKLGEAFRDMREKVENEVLSDRHVQQTPVMKRTWNGDDLRLLAPLSVSQK